MFLSSLRESLRYMFKDKVCISLWLFPLFFTSCLYAFLIYYGISNLYYYLIDQYFNTQEWMNQSYFSMVFISIVCVITLFFLNWPFLLLCSILTAPFNDLLCARVHFLERKKQNANLKAFENSLNIIQTISNQFKKISFILFLSMFAFILSIIPFMIIFAFIIGLFLISFEFLDYSWSRDELKLKKTMVEYKQNKREYFSLSLFFYFFMSIPFLHLFAYPWAVVAFAQLREKLRKI